MDDRMLSQALDDSAPATSNSPEIDTALGALLSARRPRDRRSVLTVVAVSSALVLGGATAAAAGPQLLTHLGWYADTTSVQVTSDGTMCAHGFRVATTPEYASDPEALTVARNALISVDIDTIDTSEVLRWLEPEIAGAEYVEGDSPWKPTSAYVEQFALFIALSEHVREAVAAEGFDPESVSLDGATECDGELTVPVEP